MEFEYTYGEVGSVGQYQELKTVTCYRGEEFGVSSLLFDPQEDLLWAATYGGHVTSYYSSSLEKYTCFQAHHEDVRQLQPTMGGVVSITQDELRLTSRTGLPLLSMKNIKALQKMNCALYLDENALLVGCQTGRISTVDLTQGRVTRETLTNSGICLLKPSEHCICCGDVAGHVFMADPLSLHTVAAFPAHMAGMCDMDVVGNYLVTCGLAQQYGQLCVETQLKVFDLRFLRPMSPCDVTMLQPYLLRSLPAFDSTILVVSQLGDFQFLDLRGLVTPSSMVVSHVNIGVEGGLICAVDAGPSCQCVGFGDSSGVVHLWANPGEREEGREEGEEERKERVSAEDVVMNPYATQETIFPDQVEEQLPFISWDNDDPNSAPFSAMPMSLSSHGRMTPSIDPEVLENMRRSHFVGYAPKPAHILRNQVPYDLDRDMKDHVPESPMMRENNPLSLVPKPFRQVEIKYSKLGIETFDFGHYNETKFAGLEIHIPNAYCNCMLQVLYFLEPIRCALQHHLCSKEFCLACELGLLFRMLDRSDGRSCQASNFLRAFRTLREAAALGLLLGWENEERRTNLGKLIQSWIRFVLQQLHQETDPQGMVGGVGNTPLATPTTPSFKSLTPKTPTTPMVQVGMGSFLCDEEDAWGSSGGAVGAGEEGGEEGKWSIIQRLFGSTMETVVKCRCGWSTVTQRMELLFSLCYPHNNLMPHHLNGGKDLSQKKVPFASILQQSICRQQRMNSWCEKCGKYKSTTHQKSLCELPSVLTLTCQVESDQDREFWMTQQQRPDRPSGSNPSTNGGSVRWVPLTLRLQLSPENQLTVVEDVQTLEKKEAKKTGGTASRSSTSSTDSTVGTTDTTATASAIIVTAASTPPEPVEEVAGKMSEMCVKGLEETGDMTGQDAMGDTNEEKGGEEADEVAVTGNDKKDDVVLDGETEEMNDIEGEKEETGSKAAEVPAATLEDRKNAGETGDEALVGDNEVKVADDKAEIKAEEPLEVKEASKDQEGSKVVTFSDSEEKVESEGGDEKQMESQPSSHPVDSGGSQIASVSRSSLELPLSVATSESCGDAAIERGKDKVKKATVASEAAESVLESEDHVSMKCEEGDSIGEEGECAEYELFAVVSHVKEPWMETQGNLVAHIRVGPTYHQRKEGRTKTRWYLFNDFHITPMKESEVGVFPLEWLTPAILIYTKKNYTKPFNTKVSCELDPIVLLTETHSPRPVQSPATFTPLAFSELPSAGDMVGIDAEFVTLNQEEAEVKSDGTHTTLKPSQFSVARITVIRGKGMMEGSPFIDDYIATSEQVVDYLTKFSGIKPGDLDASMSSKHLTTLKASYLKLLYLLESGVKFVGHGLNKDFRVINILVPPNQIIDTVKLFHLPNQRYISLKFLAWFFLHMRIQQGSHDSCEDARTALLLYRKYQELEVKGMVPDMLQKLYETGRSYNWKVPES